MLLILGILQFSVISIIVICEYKNRSISVFLWATLWVMFGIPHLFSCILGQSEYPEWVLNEASLFVFLFCLIYLLIRYSFRFFPCLISTKYIKRKEFEYTRNVLFILLCLLLLGKIYESYKYTGSLLDTSWASGRNLAIEEKYLSFKKIVSFLFYPLSGALLMSLVSKKRKMTIAIVLLLLINIVVSRNRIEVLPILSSLILYTLIQGNKITLKLAIQLLFLGFFSIYAVYGLLIFRYAGTISNFASTFNVFEFNNMILEHINSGQGELGLKDVFYYFISRDNNFDNFGEGHTYIRMLMIFIPSQWSLGLKPPDFAISMGMAVDPTLNGYSTHPTLFGDCYANFGFLGIFSSAFWAFFVKYVDQYICKTKIDVRYPLMIIFSCCYVIIGRGSVYNGFAWIVIGVILLNFIYYFLNKYIIYYYK